MEKGKLESRKRACGHCRTSCPFLQEDGLYTCYCNLYYSKLKIDDDIGKIQCCKECMNNIKVTGNQQILKKLNEIDNRLDHLEFMLRQME